MVCEHCKDKEHPLVTEMKRKNPYWPCDSKEEKEKMDLLIEDFGNTISKCIIETIKGAA